MGSIAVYRETAILTKWLWLSFQMIAALPAVIPENGLSWIQVGTVNITEFICSIRLLLENIIDNLIEVSRWSLSNAQENSHVSVQYRWAISFVLTSENGRRLEIKQGLLSHRQDYCRPPRISCVTF